MPASQTCGVIRIHASNRGLGVHWIFIVVFIFLGANMT